jgi:hypothetical protein
MKNRILYLTACLVVITMVFAGSATAASFSA